MAISYAKTNTFVTGTTISSSAVNANFDDLVNIFAGIEAKTKTFSNIVADTLIKSTGTIEHADGLAATPSLNFTSDPTTGFYRIGTGNVGLSTSGVLRLNVSTTGITSTLPLTLGGALAMGTNKITGGAAATAATDFPIFSQLKVLQVVSMNATTSNSVTSASFTSTALTLAITPTSASNSIVAFASTQFSPAGASYRTFFTFDRSGTNVGDATSGITEVLGVTAGRQELSLAFMAYDSPATTSSRTYTVQIKSDGSNNSILNNQNAKAFLILMEVAP